MSQYFPPYRSFGENIKVELDVSSYTTKTDLKNETHVDVSSFASKTNLASLRTKTDNTDVDKLKTVPLDLAKLSNVVKNDVVKKTEYEKLVTKVGNIDTAGFALKTKHDTDKSNPEKKISDAEKKIPDTNGLVKITDMIKLAKDIAKDGGLATKSELAAVENKIPDVSGLVKEKQIAILKLLR